MLIDSWHHIPREARGATIALGNFDGVHIGHAAVLRAAHAARPDLPLAALTFEPHPREHLRPDDQPFRLTLLTAKAGRAAGNRRALRLRPALRRRLRRADGRGIRGAGAAPRPRREAPRLPGGLRLRPSRGGGDVAFLQRGSGEARHGPVHRAPCSMGDRGLAARPSPPPASAGCSRTAIPIARRRSSAGRGRSAAPSCMATSSAACSAGRRRTLWLGRHLEPARGVYA